LRRGLHQARWVDGFARVNELAEQLTETRLTYIADCEGDIYDLFVEAPCPEHGADWLVRVQHQERLLLDGRKLRAVIDAAPVLTETSFERPASNGRSARTVHQQIKVVRVTLKAPSRPERTLPDVTVTALLATEAQPPAGEVPLDWLLLTNLPVQTPEQAIQKLTWYLCRWQIEVYFKVSKSGCRVEQLQLEKRERLEPALAVYMIIAWRVLFLTMLGRECPEMPCDTASPMKNGGQSTWSPSASRRPNSRHLSTLWCEWLPPLGDSLTEKAMDFPARKRSGSVYNVSPISCSRLRLSAASARVVGNDMTST
jgi:hypothetical protein